MTNKSSTVDASRGTAIWALNSFRQDALSQFLKDLLALEKIGMDEDDCKKVRTSLEKVAIDAASMPDGSYFSDAIYHEIDRFKDSYTKWNNINGSDESSIKKRNVALGKLKKQRHKIAKKIRKHQHILANELDLQCVDNLYKTFNDLVSLLPNTLENLGDAVGRYKSRKAS